MIELADWLRTARFPDRPWLLLGKGPSFAQVGEVDLAQYNTMALNHVAGVQPVDVAHAIDMDVVEALGERLLENCRWLVIPRAPHVQFRPSLRPLASFLDSIPVLRRLDDEGRLVVYSASTAGAGPPPVIDVRWFSAEAALGILGTLGATTVRSLGVDGGQGYSAAFAGSPTMLANGHRTYDLQFRELDRIATAHGMDYRPLVPPVRVFVGVDESQLLACEVLEHSIRSHTDRPVRVTPLLDIRSPTPRRRANRPRTAFSFSRFHIPRLCGYEGRAIYLDADMLVLGDIGELWDLPFDGRAVLCTRQDEIPPAWRGNPAFHPGRQFSVMVLDCSRLDWDIDHIVAGLDDGRYTYEQLLFDLCVVKPEDIGDDVPPSWNHLEHHQEDTRLVHYTVVPTQPWKVGSNPLGPLWTSALREAVAAGAIRDEDLRTWVARGFVRSSLLDEIADVARPKGGSSVLGDELAALRSRLEELEVEAAGPGRWFARQAARGAVKTVARLREVQASRRSQATLRGAEPAKRA